MNPPRLASVRIQGYRPFEDFTAKLGSLDVVVGANGTGKSSLFEFLRFLRDGMRERIPPEVVPGSAGQVFHVPGPERMRWTIEVSKGPEAPSRYEGELLGPLGRLHVSFERVVDSENRPLLHVDGSEGTIRVDAQSEPRKAVRRYANQLLLGDVTARETAALYQLREFIAGWRFYSSFEMATDKIRRSVPVEQEPVLHENAGNLSAVLFYLLTEHRSAFDEAEQHLRTAVPGFQHLSVKALGGPGNVIAFWHEAGVDTDLTLADLSDGILRILCCTVLCVLPEPPALICIDEPDLGVHPRALPVLAGLFEKASDRAQFLLATHDSYFLRQFPVSRVAILRKKGGQAEFVRPADSKALLANLEEFGSEEIELMHRTDELEALA